MLWRNRRISVPDLASAATDLGISGDVQQRLVVDAAVRRVPHLAVERALRDVTADRAVFGLDHLELALGRILHVNPTTTHNADWTVVRDLSAGNREHHPRTGHAPGAYRGQVT